MTLEWFESTNMEKLVLEFDPPKQLAEIEGRRAVELKNIIHLAPVLTSGGSWRTKMFTLN